MRIDIGPCRYLEAAVCVAPRVRVCISALRLAFAFAFPRRASRSRLHFRVYLRSCVRECRRICIRVCAFAFAFPRVHPQLHLRVPSRMCSRNDGKDKDSFLIIQTREIRRFGNDLFALNYIDK